ncbi:MAG TPA: hypothetical protein VE869_04330 [Gemmatimonas sp.]|nr:hypothetical protein [Gemmatimonas sp.]
MSASPLMIARVSLLLTGIAAFAYSINTGNDMVRYVAIGCIAAALLLRIVSRLTGRQ